MTRAEILAAAKEIVTGDREQDYGSPENNFKRIGALWTAYVYGDAMYDYPEIEPFKPEDVAVMLALVKIARIGSGHAKEDNWVDLAGYAACGGEIETEGLLGFEDLV